MHRVESRPSSRLSVLIRHLLLLSYHCLNQRHQQALTVVHLMQMQMLAGCTRCHQHSQKVLTLSGAGLGLVALHVLQTLQKGQVVPPDGLHLPPGSLGLLPRLHS